MKKLICSALLFMALASCKSTKSAGCDAYGMSTIQKSHTNCTHYTDCIICVDTLHLPELHLHFYDHTTSVWSCMNVPTEHIVVIDTFYLAKKPSNVQN